MTILTSRGRKWAVAAAAAGLLTTTACGGGGGGGGNDAGTKTVAGVDKDFDSFVWALQQLPASLDLAKDATVNTQQVISLVTEPLERVSNNGAFHPGLAAKVSQPDPQSIVYELKPGTQFSDGTPLTADDAAWSLQHVTDAKGGAQTAGRVKSIESVTATNPTTVTVKLKFPDPTARDNLAVISYVQSKKAAEAAGAKLGTPAGLPVGSGPYVFKSSGPDKIQLEGNTKYTGTKPKAKQVSFVPIKDDNTGQLAMRSGSIGGAQVTNVKQIAQWNNVSGAQTVQLPANVTSYLTLDTSKAPFNDIHARRAVAYSIDRKGVSKAVYGANGVVLQGLVPQTLLEGVAGSAEAAKSFLGTLPQYDLDKAKAKAELAQSATPGGFSVTIPYTTSSPWAEPTILNLQENMKELGVTITPKPESPEVWAKRIFAHDTPGIQSMQLIATIPDPNAVLPRVVGQAGIAAPGLNLANWTTPQIENDVKTLTGSVDKSARWTATQSVLTQISQELPYVPLYAPNFVVALGKGFTFSEPVSQGDILDGTWILRVRATA
ncbi:ABC transporter substrate-binding protein [Amycolatopsis jejuensis]|uniref:ABC transporter substrate-binding protein n=1 Tax=Amycolatopsis jejuensis TaxID=330084 RepID=UPI000525CA58|nr:ABC transporter substrate-binding protein [Amycolatopsis jejuensis]